MQPVPIAFCITELDPGGAERALVQIVTRLDRREWSPTVICLAGRGAMADPLEKSGIPVQCLGARHSRDVWVIKSLIRALRECRPHLLQTFLFHANIIGRFAAKRAGVPHVVSGIRVAERRSRLPLWIDRATQRWVETNVCVSQSVADFSHERGGIPRSKLVVIPNGVEIAPFGCAAAADLKEYGVPTGIEPLICIGRLDEQKGHRFLFEAIAKLDDDNVQLLVVGDGPLEPQLRQRVTDLGLESRVHFTGWSNRVPELLKSCSLLVLPSLWEGMPNVVLEAMAAGLPVIASDVEGIREVIVPERTGVIVPPGNSGALAHEIGRLWHQPTLAAALAKSAQVVVQEKFTWDLSALAYSRLYHQLLAVDRAGSRTAALQ